jgi:hypothetical protein
MGCTGSKQQANRFQQRTKGVLLGLPEGHQIYVKADGTLEAGDMDQFAGLNQPMIDAFHVEKLTSVEPLVLASATCLICQESFSPGDVVTTLPCSRVFHKACVDKWLAGSVQCPVCKRALDA